MLQGAVTLYSQGSSNTFLLTKSLVEEASVVNLRSIPWQMQYTTGKARKTYQVSPDLSFLMPGVESDPC